MSEIKYKNHILATIDQLRRRKSRPDVNRICKFMLKCYKVAPKETKAELRRCVKDKSVYKVDYKGNVSYRNGTKWRRKSNKNSEMTSTASATASSERRIITSAIATLIYQDQSYLENGIAFEDLVKAAASQESKYSKKQLEGIIHKELASGSLVRLPNRNLALGPADHDGEGDSSDSFKFDYAMDTNTKLTASSANSSCRSSPLRMRGRPRKGTGPSHNNSNNSNSAAVRVGERRKMAKKVFDPSDNNLPSKKKRGRPIGSLNKSTLRKKMIEEKKEGSLEDSQHSEGSEMENEETSEKETSGGVCSVCILQQPKGSSDHLIECRDCSSKAHLSCLQSGPGILKLRPDNTWQCPHCKTCVVCCETNDAGVLTVCSICSDPYHALCHSPKIPERMKAWDQWKCTNCLKSPMLTRSPAIIPSSIAYENDNSSHAPDTPEDPFLKPHEIEIEQSKKTKDEPIDENIPDITNWSSADVYEYFKEHFAEAAPILKEQDMDGYALSMACRSDIVMGLGLPLGPALALYRIVVKLQTRRDDWTMCWA